MKQVYTKSRSGNRHPKKYNFNRLATSSVSNRRHQGFFGVDWFEYNEKHWKDYENPNEALGVPDSFVRGWIFMDKAERETIRGNKEHSYQKYLDAGILPTEDEIVKYMEENKELLSKVFSNNETINSETE